MVEFDPLIHWAMGIVAAVGFGSVAAGLYALVAVLTETEIGFLGLLIGVAVGLGFTVVGNVKNMTGGVVAAVVAALMFVVAIFISGVALVAGEAALPLLEVFAILMEDPVDFMAYVFLAFAVVPAFVVASGIRDQA